MQTVYSTAPTDWANLRLFSVVYPGHSLGVLPLCRDAVGVFYCSGRLGLRLFSVISRTLIGGFIHSAEMQTVYSTAPTDWANLRLFSVVYPGHSLGVLPLCRDAVGVFYFSGRLG